MFSLQTRMMMLLGVLFAIVYAIVVMVGTSMGVTNFYFYLVISVGIMLVQYMIGPKMVEWTMGVRYIQREDFPELFAMVEDQATRAGIPIPRVCVSQSEIPNAFAFGRGQRDGRVCVTKGIVDLLEEDELKAVIGHEITHLKNRDVLTITILSVIPMILYRIAWSFLFYGGRGRERGNAAFVGLAAFIFYFITNLLILYASRIREYFADKGSVELGNPPAKLASALYKLVYGAARLDKDVIREAEGMKAFFASDPSRASAEIRELKELDQDGSHSIDSAELSALRNREINVSFTDKMMEILSTHPNMLKRIKHLSTLEH
ncbi:MAG: M48 family metalloprotease [Candidatus Omnitrophica bacterium]|nr:M48 family metalloprotease [Candidatus Omnitrophota bacterium]